MIRSSKMQHKRYRKLSDCEKHLIRRVQDAKFIYLDSDEYSNHPLALGLPLSEKRKNFVEIVAQELNYKLGYEEWTGK